MRAEDDGFELAREAVLARALDRAPFEGWTRAMLEAAASEGGIAQSVTAAAFPGGVADLLAFWSEKADHAMREGMSGPGFASKRIRDKVAFAVKERLAYLRPHKEAARRAAGTLALPGYAALGARLAWATADSIWRGLADKSTDFNFYTKRAMLTAVWTTTFARWLADDTEDESKTNDFLAARIGNIMQYEKFKSKMRDTGVFDMEKPARWLAKLRYPGGSERRGETNG